MPRPVELSLSGGAPAPAPTQEMRPALITSGIVHAVILLLVIFGLPMLPQKKLDMPEPITVTMVAPPSDQARTTKVDNPPPKPDITPVQQTAPEPPKPPPPPTPAPTPPEPPAEKLPEIKPLDQQIAQLQPLEALPELAKPMQIIKPQPVAPPKPVTPPVDHKKVQQDQQQFDALLANLAPPVPKTDQQSKDKTPAKPASPPAGQAALSNQLTRDELGVIRDQLKYCWNIPVGAVNADQMVIDVVAIYNPDRTLQAMQLVDTDRFNKDPTFRAAAESAMRALQNPHCDPLDFPAGKYDVWKNMTFHFNPKDFL